MHLIISWVLISLRIVAAGWLSKARRHAILTNWVTYLLPEKSHNGLSIQCVISNHRRSKTYSFDHIFPVDVTGDSLPRVFLYGFIGDKSTIAFHEILQQRAVNKEVQYIFRYYLSSPLAKSLSGTSLNVQGFGIDLALKSLEYKVIDDSKQPEQGILQPMLMPHRLQMRKILALFKASTSKSWQKTGQNIRRSYYPLRPVCCLSNLILIRWKYGK